MPSFYERHILPHLINCACGCPAIRALRCEVVPQAEGRVLELGVGSGLNLAHYDPGKVASVTGIDPSEALRRKAAAAPRPGGLTVEVLEGEAEALPFEAASFDTVLTTFTLCSVRSTEQTLAEARRVLKPGGRLLFAEHGLSPDADVQRWQRRLEPLWVRIAGGCHLTRPVAAGIAAAGFVIEQVQAQYMPKGPRPLGWAEVGVARLA
jgi:SAM-dependent methyltransferase